MKKIILAATGDELKWEDKGGYQQLRRESPSVAGYGFVTWYPEGTLRGSYYLWSSDGSDFVTVSSGCTDDRKSVEYAAVAAGLIRIIDEAEPQPGPSMQEYLLAEARAIILDAARNNLDYKRALRWIADSEGL